MIAVLLFVISLSGLAFLLSIIKGYTFENLIPISVASKVLLLFLLGIVGGLKAGVYIIFTIAFIEYVYGFFQLGRNKSLKRNLHKFFNVGCFSWVVSIGIICWCMFGKMFNSWDEFSHWGDIVKVMATLDDFGTNPNSFSWFKSYPPGMSLFQYFLQKISQITSHVAFEEWLVYVAYQVFVVSFIIPITCKCKDSFNHSVFIVPISILIAFVGPLMFGDGMYRTLYIDPVLGVLFACGLMEILFQNEKTDVHLLYISATCAMLTLAKDAGLLFAVAIFIADDILVVLSKKRFWEKCYYVVITAIFTFLPTVLWKYHLRARSISTAFSGKYDFKDFINTITYKTVSYRTIVCSRFKQLFFSDSDNILGVSIPTYILILTVMLLIFGLMLFGVIKKKMKISTTLVVFFTLSITTIIYILGMLLSYMYKFSEYEAVNCSSFQRYIYIIYESIWMFLIFVVLLLEAKVEKRILIYVFVMMLFLISPKESVEMTLSRKAVQMSIDFRANYDQMTTEIMKYCDNKKVFLISEGNTGIDLCVLKSAIRPNIMNNNPWSFGEETYEGDIHTYNYTIEQLQAVWEADNYDYVALYRINPDFVEKYKGLFANENEIMENRVYKITENKMLELCN